jgi:hypothetical protein
MSWIRPERSTRIEEGQLPHLAPRHDAPGNAVLVVERLPWLGLLGAGPDRSDLSLSGNRFGSIALRTLSGLDL